MEKYVPKKPRKIMKVNTSKYEASKVIQENKKYWKTVLEELEAKHKTPKEGVNSKHMAEVLPSDLYSMVCETLKIPQHFKHDEESLHPTETSPRRIQKEPFISFRTQLHIDREMESDTDVEFSSSDDEEVPNCHWDLLKKPLREQITWATRYLQPEKEHEKSLVTKSDDVTDRIATEFCQYMTELGGSQQSQLFTPSAIKELFQIEFNTHIARGLQVVTKELPAVLDKVAFAADSPEKSQSAFLEREVSKDIETEARTDNTRAFGTSLPNKEQWHSPKNNTANTWRSSRYVPKDLVSLKTVWEGITNLRSVREYCRWMIEHPQYRRAPYLRSLGMFDSAVLQARTTFELKNVETNCPRVSENVETQALDHLRKKLSMLTESSVDINE